MGVLDFFKTSETTISYTDEFTFIPVEFTLDVTEAIETTVSAKVTEFPIEGRDNITDHVQPGPRQITLTGLISESPSQPLLVLAQALASGAATNVAALSGVSGTAQPIPGGNTLGLAGTFALAAGAAAAGALALGGENISALLSVRSIVDPDYPKRAMKGLIYMLEAGQRFTVRTYMSDDLYHDMVLTSVSFKNSAATAGSVPFTLTCRQIKTVSSFGKIPVEVKMLAPAGTSAAKAVSKGNKSPAPPKTTPSTGQSKGSSVAKKAAAVLKK